MAGVNKAILVGNLGKDPEVRHLESGVMVATFSIATNETYKDKAGERREITEWHNVVTWRGLAEIAEKYLRKGSQIYVEGKLRTRSWEKDGVVRYITEVVADSMIMLGSSGGNRPPVPTEPTGMPVTGGHTQYAEVVDDDIPF